MLFKKKSLLASVLAAIGMTAVATVANANARNAGAAAQAKLTGEQLVERHCTRCHIAPLPTDLSKEYWPFALHYMGYYVGMKGDEFADMRMEDFPPEFEPVQDYTKRYFLFQDSTGYMRDLYPFKQYIPPQPLMSKEEWLTMREYFESNAKSWTDMLIKREREPVVKGFKPEYAKLEGLVPNGLIIATQVDPEKKRIYVSNSVLDDFVAGGGRHPAIKDRDHLYAFDLETGKKIGGTQVESDVIHMSLADNGGLRALEHGRFPMGPEGIGNISDYTFEDGKVKRSILVGKKQRMVKHMDNVDVDGDGLKDIVSVTFGDGIYADANSELAVYWKSPNFDKVVANATGTPEGALPGALEELVLSREAGLIGMNIGDMNNDGLPDIIALVAQAREDLLIFINNGDRTFTRHLIDAQGPAFGGNVIEVADFDGDGNQDIVLLNGDNVAGNSVDNVVPAPRPYNGVYIFQNHGDMKFTRKNIYPMHGATRAAISDFDEDGDVDIVAVSLYVQWNEDLPQGFVYLENKGNFNFEAQTLPKEFFAPYIHVEAADVNGDNKTDIVLGLGNYPEGMGMLPSQWQTKHKAMEGRDPDIPSVLYLINQY